MTPKTFKITGLVIGKRDWKERDIVFSVLTDEDTKIDVLAKYAKKVPSRHNAGLELFNGVHCQLHQGKLWPIVTQSQQMRCFPEIWAEYDKARSGFEILGVLQRMIFPNQPVHQLYAMVMKALSLLALVDPEYHVIIVTAFKIKLLRMLGIFHTTSVCEVCARPFEENIFVSRWRYLCPRCVVQSDMSFSRQTNEYLIDCSEKKLEALLEYLPQESFLQNTHQTVNQLVSLQGYN